MNPIHKEENNMPYDLSDHPYFTKWVDPVSGIESFILTERVAPVQMPFYFVNPSISPDGEYLWFSAAFPPSPYKMLAYVSLNPEKPKIQLFPQTAFFEACPMIAPDSKGAYFTEENRIWFIDLNGGVRKIAELSEDYIANRHIYRLVTHLTISADNRYFVMDSHIGNVFVLWLAEVATGKVQILHEFDYLHNHAQFSPIDPKMILLPRDWHRDPITGRYVFMESRQWVIDTDQTYYRNLNPDFWEGHSGNTAHEWWSRDGLVCYVNYEKGIFECNPYTRETTHVWKRPLCHAHCDSTRTYYCADQSPYNWKNEPVQILFFNRKEGSEKQIVSAMPPPPMSRWPYHVDPHPQFSPDNGFIDYMTTVRGCIDVAVTPTEQLKKQTEQ